MWCVWTLQCLTVYILLMQSASRRRELWVRGVVLLLYKVSCFTLIRYHHVPQRLLSLFGYPTEHSSSRCGGTVHVAGCIVYDHWHAWHRFPDRLLCVSIPARQTARLN